MQDVIAALSPCVMTQKKEENKENHQHLQTTTLHRQPRDDKQPVRFD